MIALSDWQSFDVLCSNLPFSNGRVNGGLGQPLGLCPLAGQQGYEDCHSVDPSLTNDGRYGNLPYNHC